MISCDLINKSDNSSGFISGFFGLPGLATWAARPDMTRSNPGPNCEACLVEHGRPGILVAWLEFLILSGFGYRSESEDSMKSTYLILYKRPVYV